MNEPNPTQRAPAGHHLGPEPTDSAVHAEAQRAQAAGFDTCTSAYYAELIDEDVDLTWLRGLA